MSDAAEKPSKVLPLVTIPGLGAVPVVAVRLPDGTIALRHPSELVKLPVAARPAGGGE